MTPDWLTIFLSAVISAVVGTMAAVMSTRAQTVGRMRAERAENARQHIASLLDPFILDINRTLAGRPKAPRERHIHTEDLELAKGVWHQVKELGFLQRMSARRRGRKVFGSGFWSDAILTAVSEPRNQSLASVIQAIYLLESRAGVNHAYDDGLFHRAFATLEPRLLRKLRRELALLSAGW